MLDCDGWEHATAYHRAFESTVLGMPGVMVPHDDHLHFLWTEHLSGWPLHAQATMCSPDDERRLRATAVFARTVREMAAV